MAETWILESAVSFGDVDRDNVLTLRGVFQLLQEAAIEHANKYDTGTEAMLSRGESWVLNRMAVEIARYPRYAEGLRVETWSTGIRGFKGYRDFRVYDRSGSVAIAGSSLWVYVSVRTRSIIRVPREVAAQFPVGAGEVFFPDLESMELPSPDPAAALSSTCSLRYSDFDANAHLNNTVYLDLVQSALAAAGQDPRPQRVRIKYGRGIPASVSSADVCLVRRDTGGTASCVFEIVAGGEASAQGEVVYSGGVGGLRGT